MIFGLVVLGSLSFLLVGAWGCWAITFCVLNHRVAEGNPSDLLVHRRKIALRWFVWLGLVVFLVVAPILILTAIDQSNSPP